MCELRRAAFCANTHEAPLSSQISVSTAQSVASKHSLGSKEPSKIPWFCSYHPVTGPTPPPFAGPQFRQSMATLRRGQGREQQSGEVSANQSLFYMVSLTLSLTLGMKAACVKRENRSRETESYSTVLSLWKHPRKPGGGCVPVFRRHTPPPPSPGGKEEAL